MACASDIDKRSSSPIPCSGQKPYESYKPPDDHIVQLNRADDDIKGHFEEYGHVCPDRANDDIQGHFKEYSHVRPDGDNTVVPKKNVPRQVSADAGYPSSDYEASFQRSEVKGLEQHLHNTKVRCVDAAGDGSLRPSEISGGKDLRFEEKSVKEAAAPCASGDCPPKVPKAGVSLVHNDSAYNSLATLPSLEHPIDLTSPSFVTTPAAFAGTLEDAKEQLSIHQIVTPSEDGSSEVSVSTTTTTVFGSEEDLFAGLTQSQAQTAPVPDDDQSTTSSVAAFSRQWNADISINVHPTSGSDKDVQDEDVHAGPAQSLTQLQLQPPQEDVASSVSSVAVLSRQSSVEPSNNISLPNGSDHSQVEAALTGLASSLAQHRPQVAQVPEGAAAPSSGSSIAVISRQSSIEASSNNAAHFASFVFGDDAVTGYQLQESDVVDGDAASNSPSNTSSRTADISPFEISRPILQRYSQAMYPPSNNHWSTLQDHTQFQTREERLAQAQSIHDKRRVAKDYMRTFAIPVHIHRSDLVPTFWHIHSNFPDFWWFRPLYRYNGEDGIDLGGVTKDAMATYWQKVQVNFLRDIEITLVPGVCKANCKCEMHSKIFVHSFLLTGQVPSYLHPLFVFGIFCSPENTTTDLRQKCRQFFIDLYHDSTYFQEKLTTSCNSGLLEEDKELMEEFFQQFQVPLPQDCSNFASFLEEIVVERLFCNPPHFVELCREKLSQFLGLLSSCDAQDVWDSLRPTGEMVARLLRCLEMPRSGSLEKKTLDFLKIWLERSENAHLMQRFLKWVTGSCALTEPYIYVQFDQSFKLPFISTCINTITMPTRYTSYDAFGGMMMEALNTVESKIFSYY